jgi:DNA-binding CsgD family transcriptional regulator
MTAEGIALDLGIGAASVLTYRRRAYRRLGISGINQLLPLLGV